MSDDTHLLSLVELADAIAARQLSAVEVMTASVARAERLQPVLNCFISLQAEAALESAAAADAALARGDAPGPLHGVPLAHKDMFYRAGHVTTCGSRIRKDFVPDHDSTALARLHGAGAIYLGGAQHGGVRHRPDRPQRALGRLPQPVEPGAHLRRLVERFWRVGRGPRGFRRAWLRYRRLGAFTVDLQWCGRSQDDRRLGQPPRDYAAFPHAGHGWPAHPDRARYRADLECDRRP